MSYCECGGYISVIQVSSVSFQATCGKCNVSGVVMGSIEGAEKSQKFKKSKPKSLMTTEELIDAMKTVKGFADPTHASDAVRYSEITSPGLNWITVKENDAFIIGGVQYVITPSGPIEMMRTTSTSWPDAGHPKWPDMFKSDEMSVDVVELLEKI